MDLRNLPKTKKAILAGSLFKRGKGGRETSGKAMSEIVHKGTIA
jgi:hypothetical protein